MSAAVTAPTREVAALEAVGLAMRFGDAAVLEDVGLRLERGQEALLLGANGVGKSTLLRLLAGLLTPDAGTVRVDGADADERRGWATACSCSTRRAYAKVVPARASRAALRARALSWRGAI